MADDGMTVRAIRAIVQGIWTFILDYIALLNPLREPRTLPTFELGLVHHAPPGAIAPQDGGRDVFVHISAIERAGLSSLNEGQTIEYDVVSNRGKQSAENLKTR